MPYWYGVLDHELSFDDEKHWPSIFQRLPNNGLDLASLEELLKLSGITPDRAQIEKHWIKACAKLFGLKENETPPFSLDESQSYKLIVQFGLSASELNALDSGRDLPQTFPSFYQLYWNATRMGGRDPRSVPRKVTLQDCFEALGLEAKIDPVLRTAIRDWERAVDIKLPPNIIDFFSQSNIVQAVKDCHPNSPELLPEWSNRRSAQLKPFKDPLRDFPDPEGQGRVALEIMWPHQGSFRWYAIFSQDSEDVEIYVQLFGQGSKIWKRQSMSLPFFFWDLAQTGLLWWEVTQFRGGKETLETDIGLALKGRSHI